MWLPSAQWPPDLINNNNNLQAFQLIVLASPDLTRFLSANCCQPLLCETGQITMQQPLQAETTTLCCVMQQRRLLQI